MEIMKPNTSCTSHTLPPGRFNAHGILLKIPVSKALEWNSQDLDLHPVFPLTYKQYNLNFWCLQLNHLFILLSIQNTRCNLQLVSPTNVVCLSEFLV